MTEKEDKTPPSPPVSQQELERVTREFYEEYKRYCWAVSKRKLPSNFRQIERPDDLINLIMHKRFGPEYCNNGDFCAFVREEGVGAVLSRKDKKWCLRFHNWISWSVGKLWEEHNKTVAKITTEVENRILYLVASRCDGMLFIRTDNQSRKTRNGNFLGTMVSKDKTLEKAPLQEQIGIIAVSHQNAEADPTRLRLTKKGRKTVENLLKRGYFKRVTTDDLNCVWSNDEEGTVAFTVQITETAREYLGRLANGSNELLLEDVDEVASGVWNDGMLIEESIDRKRVMMVTHIIESYRAQLIDYFVNKGWMPAKHAEVYLLRKKNEHPGDGKLTLQRVCDKTGVPVETIRRWVKDYDDLIEGSPEMHKQIIDWYYRHIHN